MKLKNYPVNCTRVLVTAILFILSYSNGYALSNPTETMKTISVPAVDSTILLEQVILLAQSTTEENPPAEEEEEEEPDCD